MKVGIIGSGITGFTAAYYLSKKKNIDIEIFEKDEQLGGLASTFRIQNTFLERYYHHIFTSDSDLLDLLRELDLSDCLIWRETRIGIFDGKTIHSFSTPLDILSFKGLSLMDRVRFCITVLRCKFLTDWHRLEEITAREWIISNFGDKAYKVIWSPLLKSKFGTESDTVSATWLWYRLKKRGNSRSKFGTKEHLGYLKWSYMTLFERIKGRLPEDSVKIHRATPVRKIKTENGVVSGIETDGGISNFSCILNTTALPEFIKITEGLSGDYKQSLFSIKYQAVICVVLEMDCPLTNYYWLNISSDEIPLAAIIEHTHFIDKTNYGNSHICYLVSYLSTEDPLLKRSDKDILNYYSPYLHMISDSFSQDSIKDFYVFKDIYATPVYTTHHASKRPAIETPIKGLYLANTSQIYPENRGTNYSVRLGKQAAELIIDYFNNKK